MTNEVFGGILWPPHVGRWVGALISNCLGHSSNKDHMAQTAIMNFKCNFNTKQKIWMLVFLIGVVFMILQSWSTIDTFISFRTTLAVSKETSNTLPPPTVVLCQEHKWRNGHFGFLNKGEDGTVL